MRTEKENQHFIPKFYLRFFSINNNGKQIGLYNLDNKRFISDAKLKTQGSKKYYYGMDGLIEDALMHIENEIAPSLHRILASHKLPKRNSEDHVSLILFVALTAQRNPIAINYPILTRKKMLEKMDMTYGKGVGFEELIPQFSKEDAIKISLSGTKLITELCMPLEFKLIVNNTKNKFITSDFPIVRYNQYMELKKWKGGDVGFGKIGIQLFLPINSKLMLFIYDQGIYKFGNKKNREVIITDVESINQLNKLQILNCTSQLFFNHEITLNYVQSLLSGLKLSTEEQRVKVETGTLKNKDGKIEKDALLIVTQQNLRIKLKIQHLKINKKGKTRTMTRDMAQIRPNIEHLINND